MKLPGFSGWLAVVGPTFDFILNFPYLNIVSSSKVKAGDRVFTLGFPNIHLQGTEVKYTEGTISSLSGVANNPRYFQISTPVQSGNSGGPLVNEKGQVVGID